MKVHNRIHRQPEHQKNRSTGNPHKFLPGKMNLQDHPLAHPEMKKKKEHLRISEEMNRVVSPKDLHRLLIYRQQLFRLPVRVATPVK